MAIDDNDKTEAPTPRRRQEARQQGQVARSQDLTPALILLGIMVILNATGSRIVQTLRTVMGDMLGARSLSDFSTAGVAGSSRHAVYLMGIALAPVLAGVVAIAILSNVLQVGLYFNPQRLQPNLGALNPLRGLGRIFSTRGAGQLAVSLIKLTLLSVIAWSALHDRMDQIMYVERLGFLQIFALSASLIYAIALRVGIALLVLAIAEYFLQRWRLERQLRMTKQEVKDELRRMEGDPTIKLRRRQLTMQMLKERLIRDVPTADVVVTNPTEFAIALKYDADTMRAPRMVAKGQGLIAQRIREVAIECGVPILERKPLARALYKLLEVGQEVPENFYAAIADVLAYVHELNGTSAQVTQLEGPLTAQ